MPAPLACFLLLALAANDAPLTAVPFENVTLTEGFWADRQRINATATLEANWAQCEKTGRLSNFAKAAAKLKGETGVGGGEKFQGYFFNDSDVYKMLEGACDVLAKMPEGDARTKLSQRIESLIALIASAQHKDGYINGYFTLSEPDQEFKNLRDKHELYCSGHLIEAAVAHFRATGKRSLLDVAIKLADCIDSTFGPPPKRAGVCGHEEIELALIKLAAATDEDKYTMLARYFVEQRGRAEHIAATLQTGAKERELWGDYFQDYAPIREHTRAVGHAVRAMYYYSAVTDLARLTHEASFEPALGRVWDDLTLTKMYITGGIGTSASNEGFTTSFDLPNETAYAETCAGIGLVLWGQRMALLNGSDGAKYFDVAERALYNAVLSGVSLDGARFFYDNPLASKGKHHRQAWFDCACCPPNILRLFAQIGGMFYSQTDDAVFLNLYGSNVGTFKLSDHAGGETTVRLLQRTEYPWNGKVSVCIDVPRPTEFSLWFRVPAWSPRNRIAINGDIQLFDPYPHPGTYFEVRRVWTGSDCIDFTLDMPVQRIYANPAIKADRGKVTLQRGPLIYCFEGLDQTVPIAAAAIPSQPKITSRIADASMGPLSGMTLLDVMGISPAEDTIWEGVPYQAAIPREVPLTAVPYFSWDNRAACDMRIWCPESIAMVEQPPDPTIKASSSHCYANDSVEAMLDGAEPTSSSDSSVRRMTWWDHRGTTEWAQYDFIAPRSVRGVSIYWFDDSHAGGHCRVPKACRVMYKDADAWKPVILQGPGDAGGVGGVCQRDKFNEISFTPVVTSAIRVEVDLQRDADAAYSGGIMKWKVLR